MVEDKKKMYELGQYASSKPLVLTSYDHVATTRFSDTGSGMTITLGTPTLLHTSSTVTLVLPCYTTATPARTMTAALIPDEQLGLDGLTRPSISALLIRDVMENEDTLIGNSA